MRWSLPRRDRAALPRPRLRCLDPGARAGGGAGGVVPALVFERAPRRGLQVTAGHRGLRGGPGHCASLRRPGGGARRRGRAWCATPPRPSTTSPTASGWVPATWSSAPSSNTTPTCCPGPDAASMRWVECGPDGTFGTDDVVADARRRDRPALLDADRRLERHGVDPPGRDDLRGGARARDRRPARCGPAGAAPSFADWARLHGVQRAQDVRPVRSGRSHRAAATPSRPATRSSPAAARSTWSTWTR